MQRRRYGIPLMALGVLALLGALIGGVVRLGWPFPVPATVAAFHGPLMVTGFLGTMISLERAVTIGRAWAYAAPVATGVGALALAVAAPGALWLMALGSVVMLVAVIEIVRRKVAFFTIVMAIGACAWLTSQILLAVGWPIHRVVVWWIGFFVLTIASERLEMARLARLGAPIRAAFSVALLVLLVGLAMTWTDTDAGIRVAGAAMLALAVWLGIFDDARRLVRRPGLSRFIAVALLAGYAWLGIAGALALWFGDVAAGLSYDAILHALFLGFVFSMIVGHAPMVFPEVLGIGVPYHPRFYVHLGLLHASLVLRIVGDLASWSAVRQYGGLVNALAILIFLGNTVAAVLGRR